MVFDTTQIKHCQGCKVLFQKVDNGVVNPTNDLHIGYKATRQHPDGRGNWVDDAFLLNCYFHMRDLACLKIKFPTVIWNDIFMTTNTLQQLSEVHKKILKEKIFWDRIINCRSRKSLQYPKLMLALCKRLLLFC